MRAYLHRPDIDWVRRKYDRTIDRLAKVTRTIDRRRAGGTVDLTLYNTAIETALTVAQLGWALEEPPATIRGHLQAASEWVTEAVDQNGDLRLGQAETWLEVSILGGGRPATGVADQPERLRSSDETVIREFVVGLARLAEGDREAAARAADEMSAAAASAEASPDAVAHFEGLDEMIRAVATQDQQRFDSAARMRVDALAREFGRSIEQRRHRYGLLDPRGAAVAALARREGLRVPSEYAYLGADLLEAGSA